MTTTTAPEKDEMDIAEAAAFWGVSVRTMAREVHDGTVPSYMVRNRRKFSREALTEERRRREAESMRRKGKVRSAVVALHGGSR